MGSNTQVVLLHWETDNFAKLKKKKMTDEGKIKLSKGKEVDASDSEAKLISRPWPWWLFNFFRKTYPFYETKFDLNAPLKWDFNRKYDMKGNKIVYPDPKSQEAISENTTLRTLMTLSVKPSGKELMLYIVFAALGFMAYPFVMGMM